MPRGDGTGPLGYGARTGRGFGYCSGSIAPGWVQGGYGPRWGYRQYGPRYYQPHPMSGLQNEEVFLKQEAALLEAQLDEVRARLKQISKKMTNHSGGADDEDRDNSGNSSN